MTILEVQPGSNHPNGGGSQPTYKWLDGTAVLAIPTLVLIVQLLLFGAAVPLQLSK